MKSLLILFLSLPLCALAQTDFYAYPGTENLVEGGWVDKLTVVSGNLQFNIRPPKGWRREVDEIGHKILFTAPSSRSAITVQFTPNAPAALPSRDTLRKQALLDHPGAGLLQSAVCPTGYRPGVLFDLVYMPAPRLIQKVRHAFVPLPSGRAEFVLSASDDEFQKNSIVIMGMLRAFRAAPIQPKHP
jgi:hypothetical protein